MNFDQSVWDIVGLTEYHPRIIPGWFRNRLDELYDILAVNPTDDDLVREFVDDGRDWVGNWGTAIILGQEVVICECLTLDCELFDTVHIAEQLHCGLAFVEESSVFWCPTVYFTEERQYVSRNSSPRLIAPHA